jgi:hypothetical protein
MPFLAPVIGVVGSFLGTALGKMVIGIGLNLIVSKIQKKKAKKNEQQPPSGVQFDRQYGENVPRQVACGLVALAGHDAYVNTYGEANKYLEQVFILSDFPCDGLSKIWVGGKRLSLTTSNNRNYSVSSGDYAGLMSFTFYDGTQTAADGGLVANSNPAGRWTAAHVGRGTCYVIVRMTYHQERLNQFPDFLFEIRGARLYDIRKDSSVGGSGSHRWGDYSTYEFSKNPIVMDYNYRRGFTWGGDLFCGMGMADSDLPIERYAAAANICDEGAGYGPRYECSIMLDAGSQHGDNIDALMMSCGGIVIDSVEGSWPLVGTEQPIVQTFTDADLVHGEAVRFQKLRSMADLVNAVSGTYNEPANLWSPTGYDTQTSAAYVGFDRRTRDMQLDFPMVANKGQANQLASVYFKENRYEATADIVLMPAFQNIQAGDWVYWDSANETRKGTYIVQSRSIKALTSDGPRNVALSLQARDGEIYDSVGVIDPVIPIPNDQAIYLNELQDYALIAVIGVDGETGRSYSGFRLSWAEITDPTVSSIEFQWWMTAEPDNVFSRTLPAGGATVLFVQEGVVSLTEYDFRYRLISNSRPTSWVGPLTIRSKDGSANELIVSLGNIQKDIKDVFKNLQHSIDDLWLRVDGLATDLPLQNAIGELQRRLIHAELGGANANIIEEREVRVTSEAAFSRSINGVSAKIDEVAADGYLSMTAQTFGDTLSQIEIAARARKGDATAALAAIILRVVEESGVLKSQLFLNANRTVFMDDAGINGQSIVVFEGGVLKLNIAHIGTITAGLLTGANSKLQIDLNAGRIVVRS